MRYHKAYALVFVLIITALIVLAVTAVFLIVSNDLSISSVISRNIKAYYIAEAGCAKKFMEIRAGNTSSTSGAFSLVSGDSGTFSVNVTPAQLGAFTTYRLDSTGTYRNAVRRVSLTVKQTPVSLYSYFTNRETYAGNPIWFLTGDILHGPVYTNDQLHISGNPIFDGPVSSGNPVIGYYHGGPPADNPDFRQTLTLGLPLIQMPTAGDMLNGILSAAQQPDGLNLSGNTVITFLSNGTMNVTNSAKGWDAPTNVALPANGAIYVNNGTINISGTLKGNITVATAGNIYITNSLLYNTDPRTHPDSADMLGIVSGNNVYVDRSAPYNIEIDAYIVALNTSFSVANYQSGLKGILTLYGGITQGNRGPIGTFNSQTNTRISGYAKNYTYDARLDNNLAPLYFPPAKDADGRILYTKVSWNES